MTLTEVPTHILTAGSNRTVIELLIFSVLLQQKFYSIINTSIISRTIHCIIYTGENHSL